jgi:hypothetical protein
LSAAENDNGLSGHGSFFLGVFRQGAGAVDPTGKLKFGVWEVSEMIVSDFRLRDFYAGFPRDFPTSYH